MRFIIDVDGPVFDVEAMYFRAHCEVAKELGWSQLDAGTFRRAYRKNGLAANVLPGAKPAKVEVYKRRFAEMLETVTALESLRLHSGVDAALASLASYGACSGITLGSNVDGRARHLDGAGLLQALGGLLGLSADPRKRPGELTALSQGDVRTLVVTGDASVCRAAAAPGLLVVGIDSGMCARARLFQSGVALVYAGLSDLSRSLDAGAADLIAAGLLPPPMA